MANATISLDPVGMLGSDIAEANALAAKIKAASSDQSEAVKAILDTHDDPKILEYRKKRDEALAQIAKFNEFLENLQAAAEDIAANLLPSAEEGFNVEEATAKFLELRKGVTTKRKALEALVGEETLSKALKDAGIEEITSLRGTRRSGGGTSTPRPRLSAATVNGKAVKDNDGKVTFTSLAAYMSTLEENVKVDADFLKGAAFNAAGTRDLSSLDDNTKIDFDVKVGENTYKVSVTTRPKPGPRKTENKTENASE